MFCNLLAHNTNTLYIYYFQNLINLKVLQTKTSHLFEKTEKIFIRPVLYVNH